MFAGNSSRANSKGGHWFQGARVPSSHPPMAQAPKLGPGCLILDHCLPDLSGLELQAELARLQVELAGHHSSLTEAQQTSHALAEGWAEEVHNLREELHRLSAQLDEVQHLYQEAQGQMAALQSELATARALLAQTQSDSAHTEARLDTALATARTDAECARAELADVSQSAQRQIEALTMQLAEAEAFSSGRKIRVTKVPFSSTAKAMINNDTTGFVKIISDPATGEVLGGSIVGRQAAELISVIAVAVTAGLTVTDLAESILVHPALSEALSEAAE